MKVPRSIPLAFLLLFLPACSEIQPLAPAMPLSIKVKVPVDPSLRPALLSSTLDRLLYVVRDNSGVVMSGSIGPFAALTGAGLYTLNLDNVPVGNGSVLSVQLNDASTGPETPLAIGAMSLDGSIVTAGNILLELGSIQRNCYSTNYYSYQWGYNFSTDSMGTTNTGDMACFVLPGQSFPTTLMDPNPIPQNTIAFMGNGNLVDFAFVPGPASIYFPNSYLAKGGPLVVDDVFCIKLASAPGGHAWIQITDPGNGTLYQGAFFRFRMNTTLPYYAYERTLPDIASACASLW